MEDKYTQLIEVAIELFVKQGFWNTSTAKITQQAQVGTGTLFHYFSSKEALIDGVYVKLKGELAAHLEEGYPKTQDAKARLSHLCRRYIAWGVNNPTRFLLIEQLRLSNLVTLTTQTQVAEENTFMLKVVEECCQVGLFIDLPLDYLTLIIATQLDAATKYAITHQLDDAALRQHLEQSLQVCWNAVARIMV